MSGIKIIKIILLVIILLITMFFIARIIIRRLSNLSNQNILTPPTNFTEDTRPVSETNSSLSRFGIDGSAAQSFEKMNDLNILTSGINGLTWGLIEPNPSNRGIPVYKLDIPQVKSVIDSFTKHGRNIQLNLNVDNEWALEREGNSIDPRTGLSTGKMVKIKDEHMAS